MVQHKKLAVRSGSVLPLLMISMVALCGLVALAVDIGMITVAKTQCQNAADVAAFTASRNLDGSASGNTTNATANGVSAATSNLLLNQPIVAANVQILNGAYHYDPSSQKFTPQFPPVSPDNYNLSQATVTGQVHLAFARVFSISLMNVSATATATHRPRDISIVLDYSGSMNNESDLWNCESYLGSMQNTPNNTDPVVPAFGAYSSANATLISTSADTRVGKCNVTTTVLGIPAIVNDFYQNARGSNAQPAFTSVPYTQLYLPPGTSDQYMAKHGTTTTPPTFAVTVQDVRGSTIAQIAAKTDKVMTSYPSFKGYVQGPGYWGRTFFIWPPDPYAGSNYPTSLTADPPKDWRQKFFLKTGGAYPTFGGPVNDNTKLWDANGNWLSPSGNYVINYRAILAWIQANCIQQTAGDNKPFPPIVRSGNLVIYDSVPNDVPTSVYDHTVLNSTITDPNQRFWKEYIDFTIGVWRDSMGNINTPGNPACSYGPDFSWGTVKISGPVSGYATAPTTRMNPQDNPLRPRHRFWFGPMTLVQFLLDAGYGPGTMHDISMVAGKLGVQGGLIDCSNNHPNDLASLLLFSRPTFTNDPPGVGSFNQAQYPLSHNFTAMQNALYYPPNTTTTDARIWDVNGNQTPRAHGDYCANTTTNYGFMLAQNQFSTSTYLQGQGLGGLGRKGSQKLLVLETDGMANCAANANFTAGGSGAETSYYSIGPKDSVTYGGDASNATIAAATRLCALDTDMSNGPGYSTGRKPVMIQCIAFGAVFEPDASGSEASQAMSLLGQLSTIGGTSFPTSVTDTSDPNFYKLCTGTLSQRQSKLQTAFQKILDDGAAVVLVK